MRALLGPSTTLGLLALLLVPTSPALSGCSSGPEEPATCDNADTYEIVDTTPATVTPGDAVSSGQCVSVQYEGRRKDDGVVFDAGRINFRAGGSRTIAGFAQSVVESTLHDLPNQRVGESRRVVIPPELGYGTRGAGADIPACTTLEFDITVLDLLAPSACG